MNNFLIYDIESFPNFFSFYSYDLTLKKEIFFEVSWRKNQIGAFFKWIDYWQYNDYHMVGFNNLAYDYPMIHEIITGTGYNTAKDIYTINERIINTPWNERHTIPIRPYLHKIKQIDLLKVHHFDNDAKRTSLKQIEFVMRRSNISESEYPFGEPLPQTDEAADKTLKYNRDDISNTYEFFMRSIDAINFRFELNQRYNRNFLNYSDSKIGEVFFVEKLKEQGINCYDSDRNVIQTFRESIPLKDCIFSYIQFERPEFKYIRDKFYNMVVYETKGAIKEDVTVDGFTFSFGLGGIHGSVNGCTFESDDDYIIIDADVTSYYPKIGEVNRVYPEHLSPVFCHVTGELFNERAKYKKGTALNKGIKLSLNSVYGNSNSIYSPFYDPKYTMTITVNGQLMLCMLSEQLMKIPNMQMIQANTDGITVKIPRKYEEHFYNVCNWWQSLTALTLEYVEYKRMIIRDVNNYIAIPYEGKPKFKGAYVYSGAHEEGGELEWHKNHSALVVKKAVKEAILNNIPLDTYIRNHKDIYDFFKMAKLKSKSDKYIVKQSIVWGNKVIAQSVDVNQQPALQKVNRYIVTNTGYQLLKVSPPLKRRTPNVDMIYPNWHSKKITGLNKNRKVSSKSEYDEALRQGYITKDGGNYEVGPDRITNVEKGFNVTICNEVLANQYFDINYEYYIEQAEKLVHAMQSGDYS